MKIEIGKLYRLEAKESTECYYMCEYFNPAGASSVFDPLIEPNDLFLPLKLENGLEHWYVGISKYGLKSVADEFMRSIEAEND